MEVLSEDKIKKWILPHLSKGNRGEKPKVSLSCIVKAILYKLKSGCQWRQLPVRAFFDRDSLSWQGVYHHFRKWSKDNSWRSVWVELLKDNRQFLDLSSVQLDGSHTLAKNGGEAIGYQGRKGARSSNSLFLVDNQGVLLCCSTAEAGNHHDLFEIKEVFEQMYELLREAGISLDGVFLNSDAGFDS
jgi:transposase